MLLRQLKHVAERLHHQVAQTIGAELNLELKYTIRYLMTVGLHLGVMTPGAFYDGNLQVRFRLPDASACEPDWLAVPFERVRELARVAFEAAS